MTRPISDKTKRRYVLAGLNEIERMFPNDLALLSRTDRMRTRLRNAENCTDPERKARIEASAAKAMTAIERIVLQKRAA